ncbi:E3 ubiquitin-protein ligase Midline-1-like, partial [Saccostrea cucullata]|uniref:E3 ubiquitin-protein ligase Midline-1-like n=1 Tax=Saccostrea cuccullata TaxID=36930 RepID=UPI002ED409C8
MDPCTSAQDVMRCDLCETALVQMHCDTCLVNLCKACVGEHISTDESKDHKIVNFQTRKSTLPYHRCITHTDKSCELHCRECNIPICSVCIASKLHRQHDIHLLKDNFDKKKEAVQKEINVLEDSIYPTYLDIVADVQNTLSQLDLKHEEISAAITKHDSHDVFKILYLQLDSKKYRMLPSKLNVSNAQFSSQIAMQEQISKMCGKIIPPTITADNHGYSIKTAKGLIDEMSPLQDTGFSLPVKQLLDEPETVTIIDTGYGEVSSVAYLSDEEIWTSGDGRTMKLFSINQGLLLKSIQTRSGYIPIDIAVSKGGDLVYTDNIDRTVNILENAKKKRPGDQTSELETLWCLFLTENKNQDICVSDIGSNEVVVVNLAGKLRFRYTGHTPAPKNKPFNPRDITTDSQRHILTADFNNHCVHIVDQNGQFLRYIDC